MTTAETVTQFRDAHGQSLWLPKLHVDQYHEMIERGILQSGEPWELLDGVIVRIDKSGQGESIMGINPRHSLVTRRLGKLDSRFERYGCHMRVEQPIELPPYNEPEPDGAIVIGDDLRYIDRRPRADEVLCVLEVADSSLPIDRGTKQRLYASVGIPMFVLLSIPDRTATVLTHPDSEAGTYAGSDTLTAADTLGLPTAGDGVVEVKVGELLPG